MFYMSTKKQTVTRVDKEKFSSDLQVYIQSGQTFFSYSALCTCILQTLCLNATLYAQMPLNTIYYLLLRPTLFSPDFLVVCPPSITSVVVGFVFIPQLHTLNSIQSSYSPGFFWHLSTCICIPVKGNIFIPFHFPSFPFPMVFSISVLWPTLPAATCIFKSSLYF